MPFNGKRSYRKKRGITKKRSYKKRGGVSVATKRYIKRTIHSQIENKIESADTQNGFISSYYASTSLFTLTCIPYTAIVQGLGQGDRIGNVIKTRSCFMNYSIAPYQYDAVFNPIPRPCIVMVFFGKLKNSKPTAPTSSDYAKLYQTGNSSIGPYSTPLDLIKAFNKDYFTIYKVFQHKLGFAINTNSGANVASASYANNDFKLMITNKVNLTKMCPKTLKFNDTTNTPTNDGLYMWALTVNADGVATTNTKVAQIWTSNTYTYEDA